MKTRRYHRSAFENSEIQKKVKDEIFSHPDWIELDRDTLDSDIAIERAALFAPDSPGRKSRN